MRRVIALGGLIAVVAVGGVGCFQRLAAVQTAAIMDRAAPALQRQADPGIAEDALPYSIVQMEGLLTVIPDNEGLRVNAIRAYSSYAFGFLEDHYEQAEIADDEAQMEHWSARATSAYVRARQMGMEQLTRDRAADGGADGAFHRGYDAWVRYLGRFDSVDDVPLLFWTGYAWARYINLHKDDVTAIADLPFAVALFERSYAVDPGYMDSAPRAAMGGVYASRPAALGGDPVRSRAAFDAAIAATHRQFLTYLVLEARLYAVMVQDRGLFRSLLQEVIDAGDVYPDQRLANQLAKRRARRYLAQIDTLFADAGPSTDAPAPATPAASPTATPATP